MKNKMNYKLCPRRYLRRDGFGCYSEHSANVYPGSCPRFLIAVDDSGEVGKLEFALNGRFVLRTISLSDDLFDLLRFFLVKPLIFSLQHTVFGFVENDIPYR